jgi:nucleoside-diphosphate-sugar epimerase
MNDARSAADERFLVTGALGCIGVWVLRELLAAGSTVVASDVAAGSPRLRLVLENEHDERLIRTRVDVREMDQIERVLDEHAVTRVIHLGALQVPFCRVDPPLGAAVNVLGTANVLEAAKRRRDRIPHLVYASSIAAVDPEDGDGVLGTIYGVYKKANEQMAMRYWLDEQLPSIGLRPHTVFGPARDQGLTSAPTMAMLAAAASRPYVIPYGGGAQFQYARDVAQAFVAAAMADANDASVHNLRGEVRLIPEVIEAIIDAAPEAEGLIGFEGEPLTFPSTADSASLDDVIGPLHETPFATAVDETIATFRSALADGRVDPAMLG